LICNRTALTF